jgi:hypothetical protein
MNRRGRPGRATASGWDSDWHAAWGRHVLCSVPPSRCGGTHWQAPSHCHGGTGAAAHWQPAPSQLEGRPAGSGPRRRAIRALTEGSLRLPATHWQALTGARLGAAAADSELIAPDSESR